MPPFQSKCNTIDYLEKVRAGTYYVPNYRDMQIRPCPNPPKKKRIFEEIIKLCQQHNVNFGMKDETYANADWFLDVLSSINPNHPFFHKSYVPNADDSKYTRISKVKPDLSNDDGFFDGLPPKLLKNRAVFPVRQFVLEEPKPEDKESDMEAKFKAEMRDMMNKMNKLKLIAKEKDKHLKEAHETIKSMKFGPAFAQGTAADDLFGDPSKEPSSPDAKFKPNASDKPDANEDMSGEPSQKQSPRFESTEKHAGKCKNKKGKGAKGG